MKSATINVPFEVTLTPGGQGFGYVRKVTGLSSYGSDAKVKKNLRRRLTAEVMEALDDREACRNANIGTAEGTIILVERTRGTWGYRFAGPRFDSVYSGCMLAVETFEEACDAAITHADRCYDGVVWQQGLPAVYANMVKERIAEVGAP